ncbi:MAG: thermonuclease family protein [Pseudomonadota bacterium]
MRRRAGILDLAGTALLFAAIMAVVVWLQSHNEQELQGRAVVFDGDSIRLNDQEIRLQDIDAPELDQTCFVDGETWPCGRQSRNRLRQLLRGQTVRCESSAIDQYDRWLATCYVGEQNINRTMVEQGWAVEFGHYGVQEKQAERRKAGIWRGTFDRPQVWRDAQKR